MNEVQGAFSCSDIRGGYDAQKYDETGAAESDGGVGTEQVLWGTTSGNAKDVFATNLGDVVVQHEWSEVRSSWTFSAVYIWGIWNADGPQEVKTRLMECCY